MDSFAGSEPRKLIPFRLGKGANGQPSQTLPETSSTKETPVNISPGTVNQTASLEMSEGAQSLSLSPNHRHIVYYQVSLNLLSALHHKVQLNVTLLRKLFLQVLPSKPQRPTCHSLLIIHPLRSISSRLTTAVLMRVCKHISPEKCTAWKWE